MDTILNKQGSETTDTGKRDTCIMDLPNDSFLEIFVRLPIKAAMTCMLVCKEWNQFISHPHFIRAYQKNPHFTSLLLPSCYEHFSYNQEFSRLLQISTDGGAILTPIASNFPRLPGMRISCKQFIESSVGLLCCVVWKSGRICVYNLITEELIAIHKTIIDAVDHHEDYYWEYQFGYSSLMDEFKVLRFDCDPSSYEENHYKEVNCEILTIGVDSSWRYLVQPFRNGLFVDLGGVVVNGVVHWFVGNGDSEWICTFEFGEEKIGKISNPNGLVLNSRSMSLLDHNNNQLCLMDKSDSSKLSVWVMKQYGVTESWVNYTVLWSLFPVPSDWMFQLFPVAMLPNGDIVFLHYIFYRRRFICCNLKQCTFTIADRVFEDSTAIKVPLRMLQAFAHIDV